tara:strand:+ start:1364 stop:1807 length:444 start_codon:yes stop_codon:yes gene_type:complete
MAGLINGGQVPPTEQGPDENNPAFVQAMKFMLQVLYEKGAAKSIAEQLRLARDKVDALANISYDITSTVDERTKGAVPRELIGLLAMAVLKEVTDIAQAAKIDVSPQDAAGAFKTMLLRYLGENGVDTSQLQQGMDQIDPSVFSQGA